VGGFHVTALPHKLPDCFDVVVLGEGELSKPLMIQAHQFSRSAIEKIQKAGGKAERIKPASAKKEGLVKAT